MKRTEVVWTGIFLAIVFSLQAQTAISIQRIFIPAPVVSSSNDLNTMLEAVEATTPMAADAVPVFGTFQSAQNPLWPPLPGNIHNTPAWDLGEGVWLLDDLDVDYTATTPLLSSRGGMHAMFDGPPGPGDGGDDTNSYDGGFAPAYSFPTNGLWLQITNVANGLAYLTLHNATNSVYKIISKTDLLLTNWTVEQEVWPTNPIAPFIVPELNRTNLFVWAMDWTGVTSHGNTTPEWWLWKYFATVDLLDTNLDSTGENTLLYYYQHGLDPNVIQFSLQFTNTILNTTVAYGSVAVQIGVPSYIAVLINDTNKANAAWQPYSSTNVIVSLGLGNGLYNVLVGLRGLPSDARQSWVAAQLTLDSVAPTFVVTNPTTSTVSVPMIQLQGYVSASLTTLTYDVSNAAGIFTNQPGYWQPSFYDTNLLAFTTNSFQCYDIGLTNGLNRITLHATDVAGNITTTNFSYTLDYSGDTNPPVLSVVWPTNGTAIAGSNFTMQAQMDDVTATVTATINSNSVTGLVERSGTVWFNNLPLNSGTNTVTITATDAAGNLSTTNLTVIQSMVSFAMNPLASDQLNRTNVTVSGTIGDAGDHVTVNGVSATVSGTNWTATNVLVSSYGTAALNVQVTDSGNNPLVAQNTYQPQPAQVVLASYKSQTDDTYHTDSVGGCGWTRATSSSPWVWVCPHSSNTGIQTLAAYWSYGAGGRWHYHDTPYDTEGIISDVNTALPAGINGLSVPWENVNTQSQFEGEDAPYPNESEQISSYSYNHTQTHVMIQPSGQQSIGQSILYLVQAQVTNEDTGLRLVASVVRFMNQLAGTTTADVTNADGSVWSEALVSAPAGAPVEVTPIAAGNVSFTGMKISPSRIVYFSVDPDGMPASYFNANAVQTLLQSELSANVFDSPPMGKFVKVKVGVDPTWNGQLGWSNPKFSQVNRVTWHLTTSDVSYRDDGHDIQINEIKVDNLASTYGTSPTAQTYVNIFVHEGIWGNAGGNRDCLLSCSDGEISAGALGTSAYLFAPYFVFPSSRTTLRNEFGF